MLQEQQLKHQKTAVKQTYTLVPRVRSVIFYFNSVWSSNSSKHSTVMGLFTKLLTAQLLATSSLSNLIEYRNILYFCENFGDRMLCFVLETLYF